MTNALREERFRRSAADCLERVEELRDSIADEDEALALTDPTGGSPRRGGARAHPAPLAVTLSVRVRRRAELDIDEAYAWYESRAESSGEAFLRTGSPPRGQHPGPRDDGPPAGREFARRDRLGARAEVRAFVNISESAERHIQALRSLCARLRVAIPSDPWPARVSLPGSS